MFATRPSPARPSVARRLRTRLAVGAVLAVTVAGAGFGASSAMAASPLGCLDFPDGQLCAVDNGDNPGYVRATATLADGSQLWADMPTTTWNDLVEEKTGITTVTIGPSVGTTATSVLAVPMCPVGGGTTVTVTIYVS